VNNVKGGGQYYGRTAAYVGGDTQGSVFANNGSIVQVPSPNLIYGTDSQLIPTGTVNNSVFYHSMSANTGHVTMGYGAGMTQGTFTNNYLVGGATLLEVMAQVGSLTATGNKFYGSANARNILSPAGPYSINNNTYYGTASNSSKFGNSTANDSQTFSQWRSSTGFDSASTATASLMPDTVIIRPSAYTAGRANIIILAPSAPSSISVNLSLAGLANGQAYSIRNGFNFNGSAVTSGVYNSASPNISIPLNGSATTVAGPVGMGSTPTTTCPQLCVMTIVP